MRLSTDGQALGTVWTEPLSSPVLRSDESECGAGEGPRAERREAPPLFVTTASDKDTPPLPGPRKKRAEALSKNIEWMAATFGKERIGFLTLTIGDIEAGGKFRNLRDRREAQRRFHSLLTNHIAKRYRCGVVVTERHKNKGVHFHLAVVCKEDIRGEIDFPACFPLKGALGKPLWKPDYNTANAAIKREWAFWRRTAKLYGFGRHQLQPMRENGMALGRYLGEYLRKDWDNRLAEDKGARCLRYFGHWSPDALPAGAKMKPPHKGRFGWMTSKARAFREMVKQIMIVLNHSGAGVTEQNIKQKFGRRWAWKMGKLLPAVHFVVGERQDEVLQKEIANHNYDVRLSWLASGGDTAREWWWHVTEITLDHFRPSPKWIWEGEELERAKDSEAIAKRGLRDLEKRRHKEEEKMRILREVVEEWQGRGELVLPLRDVEHEKR